MDEATGFPWRIKPCTGNAMQFMVLDSEGQIVMLAEVYSEPDMTSILALFQRNPEVNVDAEAFEAQVEAWRNVREPQ